MNSFIRTAYNRCKPEEALDPGDDRYVDFSAKHLRGADGDLVTRLRRDILLSDEHPRFMVSGFRGSGKTTELRRLTPQLNQEGYRTLYIDSDDYLNLRVSASVTDLWICIAGAVDEYLEKEFPTRTKVSRFTERLNAFLNRELEINDFTLEGGVSGPGVSAGSSMRVALKENHSFRQRLNDELKNRAKQPRLVAECRDFVEEAVAFLRGEEHSSGGVVIIIDSLEKLQGDHTNAEAVRGSAENVFSRDWELMKMPCHAIFTVPPWLPFLDIGPSTEKVYMLPMCKIFQKEGGGSGGEPIAEGCDALLDLLEKRISLDAVFGSDYQELLSPLIVACGGYPRDLLRLMRDVLGSHAETKDLPLDPRAVRASVEQAVSGLGEQYALALDAEDIAVLRHVAGTRSVVGLKKPEKLRVAELFENHFVLSYRNGERWFDLHPLVRRIPEVREALEATN